MSSNSDSLPWKIAVGGSVLGVILLLVILVYIYLTRKSKNTESAGKSVLWLSKFTIITEIMKFLVS